MIYVYVNGKRMAYLQQKLNAAVLSDASIIEAGDTLVLPILKRNKKEIPLRNKTLSLSKLHGLKLYLPFPHPLIPEDNEFFYYMRDEELVLENANLTALGLLFYLTQHAISLYDIKIDILGGGKCGQALAKLLDYLHVDYRVIHKNREIDMETYRSLKKGDIIVNTAPVCYLEIKDLKNQPTQFVLDISSEKCFNKQLQASGVEIIYPGSLPEKYFPCSGADLIFEYMGRVNNEK